MFRGVHSHLLVFVRFSLARFDSIVLPESFAVQIQFPFLGISTRRRPKIRIDIRRKKLGFGNDYYPKNFIHNTKFKKSINPLCWSRSDSIAVDTVVVFTTVVDIHANENQWW